jgi:co-chaperonin GroES (HSP10)
MFKPCNRYILVERRETAQKEESLIALPEGVFAATEGEYEKVRVLSVSGEVRPPVSPGQDVVVLSKMIEQVEFDDETVYLVLENYVLGIVG